MGHIPAVPTEFVKRRKPALHALKTAAVQKAHVKSFAGMAYARRTYRKPARPVLRTAAIAQKPAEMASAMKTMESTAETVKKTATFAYAQSSEM
jgi:hypothetical protein